MIRLDGAFVAIAALSLAACWTQPRSRQEAGEIASNALAGCAPAVLLREPVTILQAREPDAAVLARLEPGSPLVICEAQGSWRRVLFPEPLAPGQTASQRRPDQYHDCLTRPAGRACRAGWILAEPVHSVPG